MKKVKGPRGVVGNFKGETQMIRSMFHNKQSLSQLSGKIPKLIKGHR